MPALSLVVEGSIMALFLERHEALAAKRYAEADTIREVIRKRRAAMERLQASER